ncbi:MAG: hypothetical protein IPN27_09885 [Cellvibrionales bacterium]|nr:hypothetical protein [Cellvibrionales bacterium]
MYDSFPAAAFVGLAAGRGRFCAALDAKPPGFPSGMATAFANHCNRRQIRDDAIAFKYHGAGDHIVGMTAVLAHQQYRAFKIAQ